MEGYLGQKPVDIKNHPMFSKYTTNDWAMLWIELYGQIDGDHHKAWVIDQVARILKGCKIIVEEASWDNGHTEYRYDLDEPSDTYTEWVKDMLGDYNERYDYNVGIAP